MAAKFSNILRVSGITLPDPSKMTIEDYDISESERNANGKMISQIIREDVHKVTCEWALLRPAEYSMIRKAIKRKFGLNVYFYIRPERGRRIVHVCRRQEDSRIHLRKRYPGV